MQASAGDFWQENQVEGNAPKACSKSLEEPQKAGHMSNKPKKTKGSHVKSSLFFKKKKICAQVFLLCFSSKTFVKLSRPPYHRPFCDPLSSLPSFSLSFKSSITAHVIAACVRLCGGAQARLRGVAVAEARC